MIGVPVLEKVLEVVEENAAKCAIVMIVVV